MPSSVRIVWRLEAASDIGTVLVLRRLSARLSEAAETRFDTDSYQCASASEAQSRVMQRTGDCDGKARGERDCGSRRYGKSAALSPRPKMKRRERGRNRRRAGYHILGQSPCCSPIISTSR